MRDHASFGYRIRQTTEGWVWTTLDAAGQEQARGGARSKREAAACVIRALARSSLVRSAQAAG